MTSHRTIALVLAALLPMVTAGALAQNNGKGGAGDSSSTGGVILIDQARAEAGGVTPGDAPGFPVTISRSGSYRLAGDLVVPDANTTAIQVTADADSVSVDLHGFTLSGPVRCGSSSLPVCAPTGSGKGIAVAPAAWFGAGVTIVNGAVKGFGEAGIVVDRGGAIVERVRAIENGLYGIHASSFAVIRDSVAWRNGGHGFLGATINVQSSLATHNGGYGIAGGIYSGVGNSVFAGNRFGDINGPRTTSPNRCSANAC